MHKSFAYHRYVRILYHNSSIIIAGRKQPLTLGDGHILQPSTIVHGEVSSDPDETRWGYATWIRRQGRPPPLLKYTVWDGASDSSASREAANCQGCSSTSTDIIGSINAHYKYCLRKITYGGKNLSTRKE